MGRRRRHFRISRNDSGSIHVGGRGWLILEPGEVHQIADALIDVAEGVTDTIRIDMGEQA